MVLVAVRIASARLGGISLLSHYMITLYNKGILHRKRQAVQLVLLHALSCVSTPPSFGILYNINILLKAFALLLDTRLHIRERIYKA